MENVVINPDFWQGKRVFLTGHTGFKGGWLALWLNSMGAQVHGYALSPSTTPSFFNVANVESILVSNTIADIRDAVTLERAMTTAQPTPEYYASLDCVLISTDHSLFNWDEIVEHATLVVDTRNATKNVTSGREKIFKA